MKCGLCHKEVRKIRQLFDKKVCLKCIEEYEKCEDERELNNIIKRRGRNWILRNLK